MTIYFVNCTWLIIDLFVHSLSYILMARSEVGQRQLLCFARALLRQAPEPTLVLKYIPP